MSEVFPAISPQHRSFIAAQKIFFTATAAPQARVNISPREIGCLRVLDAKTVVYFDKTGSGNETAAHLKADGRMTIMFCAFEGPPKILRLYGRGDVLHRESEEYMRILADLYEGKAPPGARQMTRLAVDLAKTSCGYGVPRFAYEDERPGLDNWARAKGEAGLEDYWREHNAASMDGLPTGIFEDESNRA